MKVLIVDDEDHARDRLRSLTEEIGGEYEVVAEAANGAEAIAICQQRPIDVVLMDIRMPGVDGLQAAEVLSAETLPPAVIFVTAYDEHALEALENRAVDYLLKPIRKERLKKALNKIAAVTRPQMDKLHALETSEAEKDFISASFRGGVKRIAVDQVIFFLADQKYVVARYSEGDALLEESLRGLESRFGGRFVRIHRNALVARNRLIGLEKESDGRCFATLQGTDQKLEISRRHLAEVRRLLRGG